jgi:hypothetical protein
MYYLSPFRVRRIAVIEKLVEKMVDKKRDVFLALAQGRDRNVFAFSEPSEESISDSSLSAETGQRFPEREDDSAKRQMSGIGPESSDSSYLKDFRELLLQEWTGMIDVFEYYRRWRFEDATTRGCNIWWHRT